jgi:hypothetical protein
MPAKLGIRVANRQCQVAKPGHLMSIHAGGLRQARLRPLMEPAKGTQP